MRSSSLVATSERSLPLLSKFLGGNVLTQKIHQRIEPLIESVEFTCAGLVHCEG